LDLRNAKGAVVRKFYIPTPKQVAMHVCTARNLLWGGRAGTGKSWALRYDAYMRCMARPGYRVLLLRRNFTELRDTHLDKAAIEVPQLTGSERNWRASEYTALFPHPSGEVSRLRFGHCENDDAVKQYLSSEFDLIDYDEGATFTEYSIRFINSRLRTAKRGVIPMTRTGSNPGGQYLYRAYIAKDIQPDEDPAYKPEHYEFIPAERDDNPHVNIEEQEIRLNGLPSEALRKMYRDGDWLAVEGQFFTEWSPKKVVDGDVVPWHVIQELPWVNGQLITEVPWIRYVAVLDWGYDPDPGALLLYALLPGNAYIAVQELTFKKLIVPIVAEKAVEFCRGKAVTLRIGGHDLWMSDKQVGESMSETFARKGFSMRPADTDRVNGWQRLHTLMQSEVFESGRMVPQFRVYAPGCPQLSRTIPMIQADPRNPGDILEKDDHWADTARWFAMSRPSASRPKKEDVWARLPKDIRSALLRNSQHDTLGSESVRRA
jgi:hypothetical protein